MKKYDGVHISIKIVKCEIVKFFCKKNSNKRTVFKIKLLRVAITITRIQPGKRPNVEIKVLTNVEKHKNQ